MAAQAHGRQLREYVRAQFCDERMSVAPNPLDRRQWHETQETKGVRPYTADYFSISIRTRTARSRRKHSVMRAT
jgi:hypothetical protein